VVAPLQGLGAGDLGLVRGGGGRIGQLAGDAVERGAAVGQGLQEDLHPGEAAGRVDLGGGAVGAGGLLGEGLPARGPAGL